MRSSLGVPEGRRVRVQAGLVIAGGVSAALHVAKLPPAMQVLQQQLHISLMQTGFLLSLVQLAGMCLGVLVGAVAGQIGLRRSMVTGLCLLAGASGLGSSAQSVTLLMLLRGLEGLGVLLAAMSAPGLLRRIVPAEKLGTALGFWGSYMPFGTALALLLGPWVLAGSGWPLWWAALALVSLLMALLIGLAVPGDDDEAASPVPPPRRAGQALRRAVQGVRASLAGTLGQPAPWAMALCFAVYSAQWLAVVGFLPTLYSQAGIPIAQTALLTALVAAANIGGNLASALCLQRGLPAERLLLLGFATMALGAGLAFAPAQGLNAWLRYVGALLFSLVGGLVPGTLFGLTVRLTPQTARLPAVVGWVQQWSCLGQFAGPPLVAWVAQRSGGWHHTAWVTGALAMAGLGLAMWLGALMRAMPVQAERPPR